MARLLVDTLPALTFVLPETEWTGRYQRFELERGATEDGPFVSLTSSDWQPARLTIPIRAFYNVVGETLILEVNGVSVTVTFTNSTPAQVAADIAAAAPWLLSTEVTTDGIDIRTLSVGVPSKLLVVGGTADGLLELSAGTLSYGTDPHKLLVAGQDRYVYSDPHVLETDFYRVRYRGVSNSEYLGPFPAKPNLAVAATDLIEGVLRITTLEGTPAQGYRVYVSYQNTPPDTLLSGVVLTTTTLTGVTDDAGRVRFQLVRGAVVTLRIEGAPYVRRVLVPSVGTSFQLSDPQYSYDAGDPWAVKVPTNQSALIRGL